MSILPVAFGIAEWPALDLLIATVQTPAMWAALGSAVTAFPARK